MTSFVSLCRIFRSTFTPGFDKYRGIVAWNSRSKISSGVVASLPGEVLSASVDLQKNRWRKLIVSMYNYDGGKVNKTFIMAGIVRLKLPESPL
ncbi:hypothetical protein A4R26_20870 [Niastella populi]|uniref:Uncharacterized protein n=1 Tax=Niastella populi TaxID=550983 RepID=A0A1V9FNJ0_9BACT|nr:hypothetical protein A4R26_20870 [Niastella populi]